MGLVITGDTTVAELADVWLRHLRAEGRLESTTINEYDRVLSKLVLSELGSLRLRELTTSRINILLESLRGQSVNRQRKAKVVMGAMLEIAMGHDALTVNPVRQAARVQRPKSETRSLTLDDLATVRAAVQAWMAKDRPGPKASRDTADIIDLMLATGARIGEVLALRWSDVDLESAQPNLTISGTVKTEPSMGTYRKPIPDASTNFRTVALPDLGAKVLGRRRASAPGSPIDAVFPTRNGTWQQVNNVERRWRQIRKDTGLEWVTPHAFRGLLA